MTAGRCWAPSPARAAARPVTAPAAWRSGTSTASRGRCHRAPTPSPYWNAPGKETSTDEHEQEARSREEPARRGPGPPGRSEDIPQEGRGRSEERPQGRPQAPGRHAHADAGTEGRDEASREADPQAQAQAPRQGTPGDRWLVQTQAGHSLGVLTCYWRLTQDRHTPRSSCTTRT